MIKVTKVNHIGKMLFQQKKLSFNSSILHKFYALGKNLPTPKEYAFNKMKADFLKFQKNHPDVESGNVKIHLNE